MYHGHTHHVSEIDVDRGAGARSFLHGLAA
jgi:hypothetical protein